MQSIYLTWKVNKDDTIIKDRLFPNWEWLTSWDDIGNIHNPLIISNRQLQLWEWEVNRSMQGKIFGYGLTQVPMDGMF